MNENGRWMIYPERRFVSDREILQWANDLTADDGESDAFRGTVAKAVGILQDAGVATFTTETGRIDRGPAIQNIPTRTEEGRKIKEAFRRGRKT